MVACNRQQRNVASSFYSFGYIALMFGAVSGNPARDNLSAFSYKITESTRILVVYGYLFVGAETANLATLKRPLFPRPGWAL